MRYPVNRFLLIGYLRGIDDHNDKRIARPINPYTAAALRTQWQRGFDDAQNREANDDRAATINADYWKSVHNALRQMGREL